MRSWTLSRQETLCQEVCYQSLNNWYKWINNCTHLSQLPSLHLNSLLCLALDKLLSCSTPSLYHQFINHYQLSLSMSELDQWQGSHNHFQYLSQYQPSLASSDEVLSCCVELVCTKLLHYSICSKVPHKFVLSAKPSIKLNLLFRRQFLSTENVGTFDN